MAESEGQGQIDNCIYLEGGGPCHTSAPPEYQLEDRVLVQGGGGRADSHSVGWVAKGVLWQEGGMEEVKDKQGCSGRRDSKLTLSGRQPTCGGMGEAGCLAWGHVTRGTGGGWQNVDGKALAPGWGGGQGIPESSGTPVVGGGAGGQSTRAQRRCSDMAGVCARAGGAGVGVPNRGGLFGELLVSILLVDGFASLKKIFFFYK